VSWPKENAVRRDNLKLNAPSHAPLIALRQGTEHKEYAKRKKSYRSHGCGYPKYSC
jgi:hypothetical protein